MNFNKMSEHNYSEMIMGDQDVDMICPEFNAPQQHHAILKLEDISKPPVMFQKNPCLNIVTKEQSIGSKLLSMGFTSNMGFLNYPPSIELTQAQPSIELTQAQPSIQLTQAQPSIELTQAQPTVSSYQILPQVFVSEQNQEIVDEEYEENLIIDNEVQTEDYEPIVPEILMKDNEVDVTVGRWSEANVQQRGVQDPNDDPDEEVDALTQFLNGGENPTDFVAVASEKKRNPPYLIKDLTKITTKNDEPVKFCLQGAKLGQLVSISMRYTEEKYKNAPVVACLIHRKGDDTRNFVVSTSDSANCKYEEILEHPTAHLRLDANNIDIWGSFCFFITFRCLNSCHKVNGKKMEIIFKLKDQEKMLQEKMLQEKKFEIRVCKNVKRDYKEAFQEEEMSAANKRVQPESLIQHDNPTSVCQEEVKPVKKKQNEVKVHMIRPLCEEEEPEVQEKNVFVKCVPAKKPEVLKPKYYLIQLPTIEKEKNVLDTVRLYGGSVLDLESVCPVESAEEEMEDP